MTARVEVTIPGRAVPAARMTQRSKHVDPRAIEHLQWRETARMAALVSLAEQGIASEDYPVYRAGQRLAVSVFLYLHDRGQFDADNASKLAVDSLRGLVMADDRQIDTWLTSVRRVASPADEHVTVIVSAIANMWEAA